MHYIYTIIDKMSALEISVAIIGTIWIGLVGTLALKTFIENKLSK